MPSKSENLQAFPNPSHEKVSFRNPFPNTATFRILDLQGKEMEQGETDAFALNTLGVGSWKKGIYLIQLSAGNQRRMERLVVE
jgi:hypothetical protein